MTRQKKSLRERLFGSKPKPRPRRSMKNRNRRRNSKVIWAVFAGVACIIFILISVGVFLRITKSTYERITEQSTQVTMRRSRVNVPLTRYTHVQQRANDDLIVRLDISGAGHLVIYLDSMDLNLADFEKNNFVSARQRVFYNDVFVIPATGEPRTHTISLEARAGQTIDGFIRISQSRNDFNTVEEPIVQFESLSCLQLALFAHMAYIPFNFNNAESPHGRNYKEMHYQSFMLDIMNVDASSLNSREFNFMQEMEGWILIYPPHRDATDLGISVYIHQEHNGLVLAIRGTYGGIASSLWRREGAWWCNLSSLSTSHRHSQIDAIINFLERPEIRGLLQRSDIYITGHSLGGYLSYIATSHLYQMGFADNIRRVAAFSAPTFTSSTMYMLENLPESLRGRITHYYIAGDLIAGIIGIEASYEFPGYLASDLLRNILRNLETVHDATVPAWFYTVLGLLGVQEYVYATWSDLFDRFIISIPNSPIPEHIRKVLWLLYIATTDEANNKSTMLSNIIWVEQMEADSRVTITPSIPLLPIVFERHLFDNIIAGIFDIDTHLIMNFYQHLSRYTT